MFCEKKKVCQIMIYVRMSIFIIRWENRTNIRLTVVFHNTFCTGLIKIFKNKNYLYATKT